MDTTLIMAGMGVGLLSLIMTAVLNMSGDPRTRIIKRSGRYFPQIYIIEAYSITRKHKWHSIAVDLKTTSNSDIYDHRYSVATKREALCTIDRYKERFNVPTKGKLLIRR